ncbi:hypothetical protein [Jatrophihabitans endophyticus]|nr:hypothetical protein [Jatrophihabitans endophyticus]MBE7190598.1 hypothetical protein [Jatrophihabitans endophyticus]
MTDEQKTPATDDKKVDKAMEDTFPASDPPSTGGSTGPDDDRRAGSQNK